MSSVLTRGQANSGACRWQRLLFVVELDVRLVEQRHEKGEGEVAVGTLREREARVPAVQIPLQPHQMLAKRVGRHVVAGGPDRLPLLGRLEAQVQVQLLLSRLTSGRERRAEGLGLGGSDTGACVGDGQGK